MSREKSIEQIKNTQFFSRKTNQEVFEEKEYDYSEVPEEMINEVLSLFSDPSGEMSKEEAVKYFLRDKFSMDEAKNVVSSLFVAMEDTGYFDLGDFEEKIRIAVESDDDDILYEISDKLSQLFIDDIYKAKGEYTTKELNELFENKSDGYVHAFSSALNLLGRKNKSEDVTFEKIDNNIIIPDKQSIELLELQLTDRMDSKDIMNIVFLEIEGSKYVFGSSKEPLDISEELKEEIKSICKNEPLKQKNKGLRIH